MEIKELYHYMTTATEEQNDQAIEVLSEIMHDLQKKFPEYYRKYDKRLEDIYEHGKLSKEEAKAYVAHMTNKDGSKGEHWSMEQTQEYQYSHPDYAEINPVCFYVAMNMMYSDYYKTTRTIDTYAELAKKFLQDPDAPSDKLTRYIHAMTDNLQK